MPLLTLPFPTINPVLVAFGPLAIRWYALSYIAGLILGWALIRRILAANSLWGAARRPSPASIDDLLVYCAIGVIVGGRLGNVLFYDPGYYFAHPVEIFKIWEGGMAFHGGLIGALIGILLFSWRYRAPALTVLDLACLAAPIGIFFGRIANFIKPELIGRPTDVPWAVVFPGTDGLPRHPSQIYEALLEGLAPFVFLLIAARFGALRRPGLVTGAFGGSILGRHFDFEPRVNEALQLAREYELHAGIDVSDGLSLDLSRISAASGCGALLQLDKVPIAEAARELSAQRAGGLTPLDHALADGEDFELILAVPAAEADRILRDQPLGVQVTCIGEFVSSPGLWEQLPGGGRREIIPRGWEHTMA